MRDSMTLADCSACYAPIALGLAIRSARTLARLGRAIRSLARHDPLCLATWATAWLAWATVGIVAARLLG